MKPLYCWRCKMNVPMLDEAEFEEINTLFLASLEEATRYQADHGADSEDVPLSDMFRGVLERYREITGYDEANHVAILHHRLSLYGPPCAACGKPLRTPEASFCAACGAAR